MGALQKVAARWVALLTFCLVTLVVGKEILAHCQGHLIYTLDDPYIHLALAQRIALGTYGINLGETTSPSSSILWPFLILPGVGFSGFQYLPLVLNILLGGLTAFFLGTILDRLPWSGDDRLGTLKKVLLAIILVFVGNLTGLAYLGMEHSLQVLIALVGAYGLIEAWSGRTIPLWSLVMVALGPSVRYEMLGIVAAVALTLHGQGKWPTARKLILGSVIIPIGFSLFLLSHGLFFLPNSVLAKLGEVDINSCGFLTVLTHPSPLAFRMFFLAPSRQTELVMILAFSFLAWRSKGVRFWVLFGAAVAITGHFFVGHFGWFNRYEIYTLLFGAVLLCAVLVPLGRAWHWGLIFFLGYMAYPFYRDTWYIPLASQNIYNQQFQMHRFAYKYYHKPIAVNDLGWTSFQMDPSIYVLDLYGLASNEVLKQPHRDAALLDRLTRRHQVGLVMIYPDWFESIPGDWIPLGRLIFESDRITAASSSVSFFVTPEGNREEVLRQLQAFAPTLPPQVRFEFASPDR